MPGGTLYKRVPPGVLYGRGIASFKGVFLDANAFPFYSKGTKFRGKHTE